MRNLQVYQRDVMFHPKSNHVHTHAAPGTGLQLFVCGGRKCGCRMTDGGTDTALIGQLPKSVLCPGEIPATSRLR